MLVNIFLGLKLFREFREMGGNSSLSHDENERKNNFEGAMQRKRIQAQLSSFHEREEGYFPITLA